MTPRDMWKWICGRCQVDLGSTNQDQLEAMVRIHQEAGCNKLPDS